MLSLSNSWRSPWRSPSPPQNKHKIIRTYHNYIRRPLKRLLARGWHARLLIALLGRSILLCFVGGLGAAFGCMIGEVTLIASDCL